MDDKTTIALNLRRLRLAKGWTQDKVAKDTGIALSTYQNIESGLAEATLSTLQKLASALNTNLVALLKPVNTLTHVRFRAEKKMKKRSEVLSYVSRWLENYADLENKLGIEPTTQFLRLMNYVDTKRHAHPHERDGGIKNDPILTAQWTREWLKEEGFIGRTQDPITQLCTLLEAMGIKVYTYEFSSDSFFGLSVSPASNGPAIVVNTWDRISVERQIFSAAHELGHLLMHLDDKGYDVNKEDYEAETIVEENQANIFASHFLMPESTFQDKILEFSGYPFFEAINLVKKYFQVSYQAVLVRVSENKEGYLQLRNRYSEAYRQETDGKELNYKEEPEPLDPSALSAVEKRAWEPDYIDTPFREARLRRLVRRALNEGKISVAKAAEILEAKVDDMKVLKEEWDLEKTVAPIFQNA